MFRFCTNKGDRHRKGLVRNVKKGKKEIIKRKSVGSLRVKSFTMDLIGFFF